MDQGHARGCRLARLAQKISDLESFGAASARVVTRKAGCGPGPICLVNRSIPPTRALFVPSKGEIGRMNHAETNAAAHFLAARAVYKVINRKPVAPLSVEDPNSAFATIRLEIKGSYSAFLRGGNAAARDKAGEQALSYLIGIAACVRFCRMVPSHWPEAFECLERHPALFHLRQKAAFFVSDHWPTIARLGAELAFEQRLNPAAVYLTLNARPPVEAA